MQARLTSILSRLIASALVGLMSLLGVTASETAVGEQAQLLAVAVVAVAYFVGDLVLNRFDLPGPRVVAPGQGVAPKAKGGGDAGS